MAAQWHAAQAAAGAKYLLAPAVRFRTTARPAELARLPNWSGA